MSWVISTCMACTGVVLASSLNPMSLSGAPTRAMAPEGSRAAAIMDVLATCLVKRRNEV
jgi:hypothetical protein